MFLVMLGGLIVGLYDSNIPFLAVGIVAVVIFVLLVFRHGKLNEELEYTKAKVIVYERYMKRYDDSWKEFAEDGSEYLTDDDLVAKVWILWERIPSISLSVWQEQRMAGRCLLKR